MTGMPMHPGLGINWGQILIWIAFASTIITAISYILLNKNEENHTMLLVARGSYTLFAGAITMASVLLMGFILKHNFSYEYVVQYTSKDLPLIYLVSSFWAGQAGSFLLWVFFTAWLGFFLMRDGKSMEAKAMMIFGLNNLFLMILLIKQSPFTMFAHPGQIPADGNGLNMLLQDPWMAIHPPIVFLGYAAYAIPFAYAMVGMWEKKYHAWIKPALPWTFFAFVTLGAGIIIGGYWSYKVLGWGGYWAWDPVENASLLPWLFGMALMHGMILQKAKKILVKTNFFLAALSFIMVIYCTFLTRSGVLANFSVHSFTDLGITELLVLFILSFVLVYLIFAIKSFSDIGGGKNDKVLPWFSREIFIIGAILLISLSALVTGLGTSAPLITGLMGSPSKVPIEFYNKVNLPFAVLMMALLCIGPLLAFGSNSFDRVRKGIVLALIGTVLSIVGFFFLGLPGVGVLLLGVSSGACVLVNLYLVITRLQKRVFSAGGAISHLGLALMLVGIITSSVYDDSQRLMLTTGAKGTVKEYEILFKEVTREPDGKGERLTFQLEVKNGSEVFMATPDVVEERMPSGQKKTFAHPFIKRGLFSDLYISHADYSTPEPSEMEHLVPKPSGGGTQLVLEKGKALNHLDYTLLFTGFETTGMGGGMPGQGISVKIKITATHKSGEKKDLALIFKMTQMKASAEKVRLPGPSEAHIHLDRIDATSKTVSIFFNAPETEKAAGKTETKTSETPEKTSSLLLEVSTKPGMVILWTGTFLLLFGGIFAMLRRRQ